MTQLTQFKLRASTFFFLFDGEFSEVKLPGENPRLELAGHQHHHFKCRLCQRMFDVHACPGDLSQLARKGLLWRTMT